MVNQCMKLKQNSADRHAKSNTSHVPHIRSVTVAACASNVVRAACNHLRVDFPDRICHVTASTTPTQPQGRTVMYMYNRGMYISAHADCRRVRRRLVDMSVARMGGSSRTKKIGDFEGGARAPFAPPPLNPPLLYRELSKMVTLKVTSDKVFCMLLFYMIWSTQKNIKSLAPFKLRSFCCE